MPTRNAPNETCKSQHSCRTLGIIRMLGKTGQSIIQKRKSLYVVTACGAELKSSENGIRRASGSVTWLPAGVSKDVHPKGQGRERLAYNSSSLVCFFSRSTTDKRDYKPHSLSWGLFDYLLRPLKCLIIIKGTLHAWMTQSFTPPPSKSWLGYKNITD